MTTDTQQPRMWQGLALAEDLYARMANSLMPLFQAQGFIAYMCRRKAASDPWGPRTIAYRRGFDPGALESTRPQDIFYAIGGVAIASDTCQVKLSLVRTAPADPFNEQEIRLAQHLTPLLEGAVGTQLLLQESRELARREQDPAPASAGRPWDRLNLTRAEADVLELLLQGLGVKQISQRRRSSYHTVRSQLASLLSKADCHSQRELILRMQAH
jgi:DNA-binding CsgD family transcriptional regulator